MASSPPAAATIAYALAPAIHGYLFAGHRSQEPGHALLLEHIGLQPILDLQMRLGEGSGAVLAMPIIESGRPHLRRDGDLLFSRSQRGHTVSLERELRGVPADIAVAFQFLTRLPMPRIAFDEDSLARSVKFFPLVGLFVGGSAALLERQLRPHLARPLCALAVVIFLVAITGCFHEDGLADTADSLGAWTRERRLEIMRDSRIGSYGAAALVLSLLAPRRAHQLSARGARCGLAHQRARTLPLVDTSPSATSSSPRARATGKAHASPA